MAAPILTWTVNLERGTIDFGRVVPFAGNTYALTISGGADGIELTAYLMSDDGLKCLAKSENVDGKLSIAFNTGDLRDEFRREMHEVRAVHCVVRDNEKTIAEGDLTVAWNPLWQDEGSSQAFTMKGEKGERGEPGKKGERGYQGESAYEIACRQGFSGNIDEWLKSLKGHPGSLVRIQELSQENDETGVWHDVYVQLDENGRYRLVISKNQHHPDPAKDVYVSTTADMVVSGEKTFSKAPIVPTLELDDESEKAVNSAWVGAWWHKVWESITAAAINFYGKCTFSGGIEGDLVGNVDGVAKNAVNADAAERDAQGNVIAETYVKKSEAEVVGVLRANEISATDQQGGRLKLGLNDEDGGGFALSAKAGSPNELVGSDNGDLTWRGNRIVTLVESYYAPDRALFYRAYSDGWVEQGGNLTLQKGDSVTYPVEFHDLNYMLMGPTVGFPAVGFMSAKKRTDGFTVEVNGPGGNSLAWYACGYRA